MGNQSGLLRFPFSIRQTPLWARWTKTGHEKPAIQCVRFHIFRVAGEYRCSVLLRNAVDQSTRLLLNFFDLLAIAVPLIAHPCLTKLVNRGADVIKLGSRHVTGKPICDAVRVFAEQ